MTAPDESTVAALAEDLCRRVCDLTGEPRLLVPGEVRAILLASPALADLLRAERVRALREAADASALMEPWGPFEMGGFEGCTDQNPDYCACATDSQPTCRDCGREIEPGESAWSRQWPCYDTLPLGHRDQEWDVISWHDDCDRAETEAGQ